MKNLINIETKKNINNELIQTVNARHLHEFLEIGKDFTTWIKDRIKQYGFAKNIDYIVFANSGENPFGGRPAKEYHIPSTWRKRYPWFNVTKKRNRQSSILLMK